MSIATIDFSHLIFLQRWYLHPHHQHSLHVRASTGTIFGFCGEVLGCALGCFECLCKKIIIGIVASNNKIKLPFDMGFNKIEKFCKNFSVYDCPQGSKVTENKEFS